MKSADIFFFRVIVWYTLHSKFSKKLVSRQMQMLAEIYGIWPTLQHVHDMSMTFLTKSLTINSRRATVCRDVLSKCWGIQPDHTKATMQQTTWRGVFTMQTLLCPGGLG